MVETAGQRARYGRILGELAELSLTLARNLHARALAAETPAEAEGLALAFQRVSRSVRQTLALELKVERGLRAADREDADRQAAEAHAAAEAEAADDDEPDPEAEESWRVRRRADRVRGALKRLIWDEAEGDEQEYEVLIEDLDHRLSEAARRADFHDLPIEALIRQLKADMGLPGALVVTACDAPAPKPPDPALGAAAWATGRSDSS